jgi:hypothetical protein
MYVVSFNQNWKSADKNQTIQDMEFLFVDFSTLLPPMRIHFRQCSSHLVQALANSLFGGLPVQFSPLFLELLWESWLPLLAIFSFGNMRFQLFKGIKSSALTILDRNKEMSFLAEEFWASPLYPLV